MTLAIFIVAGSLLLLGFLVIWLRGRNTAEDSLPALALPGVVELPGMNFAVADLLFDDRDFAVLSCAPALRQVTVQLRRDRRRLTLLWLSLMRRDTLTLWRFRRLLVTAGITTSGFEEFRTAAEAIALLLELLIVRIFVWLFGPFAVARLIRATSRRLGSARQGCSITLQKLSPERLREVEQRWLLLLAQSN